MAVQGKRGCNDKGITRRSFLGAGALTGAALFGASLAGCAPTNNQDTQPGDDVLDERATTIDENLITETRECDVVVAGLGVAGVAALRAAAEAGANVIAVEKTSNASCRSSMFASFNGDVSRALGVADIDPTEIANELMIQMAHRGDYRVIMNWLSHCGESFDWYVNAYDGLILLKPGDNYPEDPDQIYLYAEEPQAEYRFGIDHERFFSGCCCVGGGNETHRPILEANIEKALSTGNAEAIYDSPAVQLEMIDGRVGAIVCQNLQDETYTRYKANKGIILATGDYSHNDEMLKEYAPWVYANLEKYLVSHEAVDATGAFASMGDGQKLGESVGGHLDAGPHAVMAHIFQFGIEHFIEINEHGERFCNEDLSMTNVAKIIMNQPGNKVFQILDANAQDYYPPLDMQLGYIRSFGDGETYSAEADTLEELADQLGFAGKEAENFLKSITRYNELCEKGHDDDFGKAAEKMHPVANPPFRAITYDLSKHTSVDDVSCMRLLVTMGGLVTNDSAQVLDDDLQPIPGLYAVGNTQGGRFVDDYPFTLSGASHGAALTYGYLAGQHVVKNSTSQNQL